MNTQVTEILELSIAEKIQIVEDIWDSISNSPEELTLSEAEKSELDKRLESYKQNSEEIGDEVCWDEQFKKSSFKLEQIERQVRKEIAKSKAEKKEF